MIRRRTACLSVVLVLHLSTLTGCVNYKTVPFDEIPFKERIEQQ